MLLASIFWWVRGGLTCLVLLSTSLIIYKYNDPILGLTNVPHIMDLFQGQWSLEREGTPYFTYNSNFKRPKYEYNSDEKFDDINSNIAITHYNLNLINNDPDSIKYSHKVLILTVMDKFNAEYWSNLQDLSYPRKNIELGIMVSRQGDYETTLKKLYDIISIIQKGERKRNLRKSLFSWKKQHPLLINQ